MAVTDALVADVVERLAHDLRVTGREDYVDVIEDQAQNDRTFIDVPERFVEKVVEDVQQRLHDDWVDTVWPRCPRHGTHPLWFHDGAWFCDKDRVPVAQLGALVALHL